RGCGQIRIGSLKVDVIECIHRFDSELKVEAVPEAKIAEQGEIDAFETVTWHDVAACVAEGSQHRRAKRCRIECLFCRYVLMWIADHVGPIETLVAKRIESAGIRRERLAGLSRDITVNLPASPPATSTKR